MTYSDSEEIVLSSWNDYVAVFDWQERSAIRQKHRRAERYRLCHRAVKAAKIKYGNVCQRCKITYDKVDVHHVNGWQKDPNTVTVLCPPCHRIVHRGPWPERSRHVDNALRHIHYVESVQPYVRSSFEPRIGRNEPCCCGSGKKYKKCCFLKAG